MNNKSDATCGDPTCTHDWCQDIRAAEARKQQAAAAKHEEAVKDVAAALKQVFSVAPQLLYEASVRLGSETILDKLTLKLNPNTDPKAYLRATRCTALCMALTRTLLNAGLAQVTERELNGLASYMTLVDRFSRETEKKLHE